MEENFIKIYHWLYPLSWLYGIGVCLRNKLFDWGWLRSKSFDVPVICVGNLAVGGTGKTPHTEYLIKLLQKNGVNVATLSRGYKRKSRGYVLADDKSNVRQIGDEPYQIKNKFPNARVAVDENRCHGIEQLLKLENPTVEAIILDDAFQHRHVKAGLNILLTDFHRLLCDDASKEDEFVRLLATMRSMLPVVKAPQSRALLLVTLYGCTDSSLYRQMAHEVVDPWRGESSPKKSKAVLIRRLDDYDRWLKHERVDS